MKKTKGKKLISLLLSVLIIMSSLTVGFYAFAADDETVDYEKIAAAEDAVIEFVKDSKLWDKVEANRVEPRKKYNIMVAAVKELNEVSKVAMNHAIYAYVIQTAVDDIVRTEAADITKSPTGTQRNEIFVNRFADIEKIVGKIPSAYVDVFDAFKSIYYGESNQFPKYVKPGAAEGKTTFADTKGVDYGAEGVLAAADKLIDTFAGFTVDQWDFSDAIAVNTTTGEYYLSTSANASKGTVTVTANNTMKNRVLPVIFAKSAFDPNESYVFNSKAVAGNVISKSDYVSSAYLKDENNQYIKDDDGNYLMSYSWVGENNAETFIRDMNKSIDMLTKGNEKALEELFAFANKMEYFNGFEEGLKGLIAASKENAEGKLDVETAKSALAAFDAVKSRALRDLLADNSMPIIYEYKYKDGRLDPAEASTMTAEQAYKKDVNLVKVKYASLVDEMNAVITQAIFDNFIEYFDALDADAVAKDADAQAELIKRYQELTWDNKVALTQADPENPDAETRYDRYCKMVALIVNTDDYAEFVKNFEATDIWDLRPAKPDSETEAAWYENGIQVGVDGLWAAVTGLMDLAGSALGLNIDLNDLESALADNLYQPSTFNAVFGLFAQLSHDETNLGPAAMNLSLGSVINAILAPASYANKITEPQYKGFTDYLRTLGDFKDTVDKDGNPYNKFDELAAHEFTAKDLGFTAGNQESFINALLAILRPITTLLAPGGGVTVGPVSVPLNVEMFDKMDQGAGEYKLGLYSELIPLLEQLGITNIPTNDEYKENYEKVLKAKGADIAADEFLRPVIEGVFAQLVSPILNDPLNGIIEVLPRLAYVLDEGIINTQLQRALSRAGSLSALAESIPVIDGSFVNDILHNAQCDSEGNFLGIYIATDANGKDIYLTIPDIDWAMFANCCTVESLPSKTKTDDYFVLRTGDPDTVFTKIFEIVYNAAFAEPDFWNYVEGMLADLIKGMQGGQFIKPAIDAILGKLDIANWSAKGQNYAYGKLLDYCVEQYVLAYGEPEMGERLVAPEKPVDPPSGGDDGGNTGDNGGNTGNNGGNAGNNGGNAGNNGNDNGKLPTLPETPDKGGNNKLSSIPKTGAIVGAAASYAVAASLVAVAVYMLLKKKEVTE